MQDLLLGREQTLCKMGGKVFPDHLSLKSEALTCAWNTLPHFVSLVMPYFATR